MHKKRVVRLFNEKGGDLMITWEELFAMIMMVCAVINVILNVKNSDTRNHYKTKKQ